MLSKQFPRNGRRALKLSSSIVIDVDKSTLHSRLCQYEQQPAAEETSTIMPSVRCGVSWSLRSLHIRWVIYGWYYSFRRQWGIKVKNQTRLEMDRVWWVVTIIIKIEITVTNRRSQAYDSCVASAQFSWLPFWSFFPSSVFLVMEWLKVSHSIFPLK